MNLTEHFAAKLIYPEQRRAVLEPLGPVGDLKVTHLVQEVPEYLYQHDIGAEWKVRVFVQKGGSTQAALDNVVRSFNEAAYGHLRRRLMALDMAILEHDFDKARMHIRDLYRDTGWPI